MLSLNFLIPELVLHLLAVAGFTLVSACALWVLRWASDRLRLRLRSALASWMAHRQTLNHLGETLTETPAKVIDVTLRLLTWGAGALIVYQWALLSFRQFEITRPWAKALLDLLVETVTDALSAVLHAIPSLLMAAFILWMTFLLTRLTRVAFHVYATGRLRALVLDHTAARTTRMLITFGLWAFGLTLAFPFLPGADSEAFKGVAVLLGLMASLGSSSIVAQAFSGMILIYGKVLRAGEYVMLENQEGTVKEIGLFATTLETGNGEQVIVPNSKVVATATRNYSRDHTRHQFTILTTVNCNYGVPWRQVHSMLQRAAANTPGLDRDCVPEVLQTSLADFYVQYQLIVTSTERDPAGRLALRSALNAAVLDQFNLHQVSLLAPHYMVDPSSPHLAPLPPEWDKASVRPETSTQG